MDSSGQHKSDQPSWLDDKENVQPDVFARAISKHYRPKQRREFAEQIARHLATMERKEYRKLTFLPDDDEY